MEPVDFSQSSIKPLKLSRKASDVAAHWKPTYPMVSVLISTYNHADFIENALDGALMQESEFPFEVIVRDDGSTDGTPLILREYEQAFPGIVRAEVVAQNSYARTRPESALRALANGAFIAWCDGDDYWTRPDKLQTQATVLLESEDVVLTHHLALTIDRQAATILARVPRATQRRDLSSSQARFGPKIIGSTAMHRNLSVVPITVNSWLAQSADFMLFQQLTEFGGFHYLKGFEGAVRRVHGSNSSNRGSANEKEVSRALSRIFLAEANMAAGRSEEADVLGGEGTARLISLFLRMEVLTLRRLWKLVFSRQILLAGLQGRNNSRPIPTHRKTVLWFLLKIGVFDHRSSSRRQKERL